MSHKISLHSVVIIRPIFDTNKTPKYRENKMKNPEELKNMGYKQLKMLYLRSEYLNFVEVDVSIGNSLFFKQLV